MGMTKEHKKAQEIMFEYISRHGIMNFRVSIYAEQVGIPQQTVSRWKERYMKVQLDDIDAFGRELANQNIAALKMMSKLLMDNDANIRIKAAKVLASSSEKVTNLLERYGLKVQDPDVNIEPQLHIHASDKELYDMLNPIQRKKFAELAEKKES